MPALGPIAYLLRANPVSFHDGNLLISVDPELECQCSLQTLNANHELLQRELAKLGYPNCTVRFLRPETPPAKPAT